jgi:hypothetical protein
MAIIIPTFSEDRVVREVDPATGSTVDKPSVYCKDLNGCGEKTYSVGQIAIAVNSCTDCIKRFEGSASISYTVEGTNDWAGGPLVLFTELQNRLQAAYKTDCTV